MKTITVKVEEEIYEILDRARKNRDITISSIVRKALEEYISRYPSIAEKCIETPRIKVCD